MELNRVSAPNDGATGIDLTNDASVSSTAAEGRAAITMMRTHDIKAWRGRELDDKTRLRIALPPGKVLTQPIKGGWFGRIRQMLLARSERVQDQSAQRLAALTLDQSPVLQGGPRWLRSIGAFRGQLHGLVTRLKERAVAPVAPQASAVAQTAASSAAAASVAASASNSDSAALAQVTAAVQQRFAAQAGNKEAFTALLQQAFGDKFDAAKAEIIRQQALAGDFSWAPKVQIVDSQALADLSGTQAAGNAQAAYVKDSDTIYLSRELLHGNPAQAQRLLMEEMGHGIDARLNTQDAVGDEGEIFAKLMHGDAISTQEMAALKADNDHGVVNINGRNVTVEYGWFKKAFKAITGGIKKVVSAVVNGVVNLAKAAVNVAIGFATLDFQRVQQGFQQGFTAITTTFKEVAEAVKDTAKELHKIAKEQFKKIMQSKLFAVVLMICRFIPIPIVQLVVRIIDLVRAAYMVYQGVKNKSISAVLGGIASLAGGASNLAGSLGASASTVSAIKSVADAASKVSMAYNAVANKDLGSALGLLGGMSGVQGTALGTAVGYAQQGVNIGQAVKSGDGLAALGGVLGVASTASGSNSEMGQQLAGAQEVVTGIRAVREIDRGNLDAAQSLAMGMNSAVAAGKQADAISAQQRADAAAANNRSLLNAADKDLRALPAEEGATTAANDSQANPEEAASAGDEQRNGSDVDSDNTAARNGGVGPVGTQTLLTVGKGQTLEGIARAQYGENWRAGLAQITLDNGLKLNQWGSPVLSIGKTLVLNDISSKSEQELASLSRTGGRIISNNDKGLQAKADLEERARQVATQKVQEATSFSAGNDGATGVCTPANPRGLSDQQLQAEAATYARLGLRPPATGPVGSAEWFKTASEAELHRNGYQTAKAWDGQNKDPKATLRNLEMAIVAPQLAAAAAPLLLPLSQAAGTTSMAIAGGVANTGRVLYTGARTVAIDASTMGPWGAYLANAPAVNVTGLVAAELALGVSTNSVSPSALPNVPDSVARALALNRLAATTEKNMTSTLVSIANTHGGQMLGLENNLKTVPSMARKIETNPTADIKDALRYTMAFEESKFVTGVENTLDTLKAQGYEQLKLRNTFMPEQSYVGINSVYRSPEGAIVELQFHTPQSFHIKDKVTHPLFEKQRLLPEGHPTIQKLMEQQVEHSAKIAIPSGVSSLQPTPGAAANVPFEFPTAPPKFPLSSPVETKVVPWFRNGLTPIIESINNAATAPPAAPTPAATPSRP